MHFSAVEDPPPPAISIAVAGVKVLFKWDLFEATGYLFKGISKAGLYHRLMNPSLSTSTQ